MSNLIPEKRLDKNGVLTTKHVRAMPKQASGRSPLPAPSAVAQKPAVKTFKPRARQLEQNHHGHLIGSYPADQPLRSNEQNERDRFSPRRTSFFASDVEIYDVLSATTSSGNALELLTKGVRTAEEARAYLKAHRASKLITDRSSMMTEALERGISAEVFFGIYENMNEQERKSPFVLDAIELRSSAAHTGFNVFLSEDVLSGKIAYSDLKEIGLSRLKPHGRGYELTDLLERLNKGEADYTVQDLKDFVVRAADARTNQEQFSHACAFAYLKGFDLLQDAEGFNAVHHEYYHFMRPASHWRRQHEGEDPAITIDRVEYGVRMKLAVTEPLGWYSGSSSPYFEAGIPVKVAIDTVNGGGGLREAKAVHEDGIAKSVAGGWL